MKSFSFARIPGLALLSLLLLSACTKDVDKDDNDNGGGNQRGVVTGLVKDAQGKPVAGAKVRIEKDFAYYDVTTNGQGQYTCKVATFGSFKALAWAPVQYNGNSYMVRVGMATEQDYDFFPVDNGAVCNFQLRHKGRIPDRSIGENGTGYFGASINFYKLGSLFGPQLEEGDVVTYTLTPIGPLMDGSGGQPLQGSFNILNNKVEYYVVDVPAGKYKVEAIVARDGADYRVYVGSFSSQTEAVEIVPRPSDYGVGNYENGFMHPANVVYMSVK